MEKDQFVAADGQSWWLLEQQLDSALEPARQALGAAWGWTELWYSEGDKVLELYQWLESNRSDLLKELDELNDDADRRRTWLETVTEAKAPPANAPSAPTTHGTDTASTVEEASAEHAADAAAQAAAPAEASAAAPEPKKSIFAKKKAAEPDIKQMLTEFAADPSIPLEPEEVEEMLKDPDFHTKLAAAEADIDAELEAALG